MQHEVAYVVIAVYLVLMVGVGVAMRRLNRDTSDYFRSGCKGTWWLVGSSAFMGAFSAWTFSGAAGSAYEAGWSVAAIYLANTVGFVLNAIWRDPGPSAAGLLIMAAGLPLYVVLTRRKG